MTLRSRDGTIGFNQLAIQFMVELTLTNVKHGDIKNGSIALDSQILPEVGTVGYWASNKVTQMEPQ